jgi:preprotein translocase subunit SecG
MSTFFFILTFLFIIVSIALVLIVLVQRPQGGGLSGAFGGGGGTDTAFGGRTGDALTVATIAAFTIYVLIAIGLNITGNLMLESSAEPAAEVTATPGTEPAPTTDGTAPATPAPQPGAITSPDGAPMQTLTPEEVAEMTAPTPTPTATPTPAPAPVEPTPAPANPG